MTDEVKGNLSDAIEEAVEIAEDVVRHPFTKTLARLGFYTKGFLFIVIGILAVLVAVGVRGGELTAPNGALAAIAQFRYGKIILIIFIVGAVSHGVWNILRGAADVDDAGISWQGIIKRLIWAGIGIFYFALAWTALNLIIRAQSASAEFQRTLTTILLMLPLGAILVGIIGLSTIGAGVHEFYSGISGKYKKDLRLNGVEKRQRNIITVLGIFGFTARGLIFALMGYFFISAAIDFNPNEAAGMDGALLALAQTYYGKTILFVTAAGLICHGILSFYEAKYRRIC